MNPPPPTRREVVTDTLHGVTLADPYRWLEHGDDPEVQQWVADQNRYTRQALDARPDRDAWHERLVALMGLPVVMSAVVRGDRVFTSERLTGADQYVLALRSLSSLDVLDAPPVVLFDPAIGSADAAVAIDWFEPSPDGSMVALGVSEGGTENSTLQVLVIGPDSAVTVLDDRIPNTRACSVAWEPDGSGFLYTRYPAGDEYHRTVFAHRLGDDPASDPVVWAEHVTAETWPAVDVSPDGRWLLVHAMVGWSRHDVHVFDRLAPAAGWRVVIAGAEVMSTFSFDAAGTGLIGTTTLDAPKGRVVAVPLPDDADDFAEPSAWTTIVPERDLVLGGLTVAGDEILLVATSNAVDSVEQWSPDGTRLGTLGGSDGLGVCSVVSMSADRTTGRGVVVTVGFDAPFRFWPVAASSNDVRVGSAADSARNPTQTSRREAASIPALAVSQVTYPSLDGTEIGMFLIHRVDVAPAPDTPTILNGYGGFAIAETPVWSPTIAAWCEQGGLYAIAGLRGGVEHGEAWHDAGRRGNKQNVFDDFHAAADWLVATGRTSRERLAIDGRSNGGLLVGAALTQRPDLCAAVSCGVPLLDMIRFPQFLIARLWTDEYGDPDVAEEFAWLHAYSPYHHVVDGTAYPATFLWTAEGDTRVDPLHARKMAALLQASSGSIAQRPILIHQEGRAGHGVGKPVSKKADEQADVLAFFTWQLDVRSSQ